MSSLLHLTSAQLDEVAEAFTRQSSLALEQGKIDAAEAFNKAREILHKARMRAGDVRSAIRRRQRGQGEPQ